jgi:hypothetical protein
VVAVARNSTRVRLFREYARGTARSRAGAGECVNSRSKLPFLD